MVTLDKLSLDALSLPSQDDLIVWTAKATEELLPCSSRTANDPHLPSMLEFVRQVAERSRMRPAALAVTLLYIQRLKPCLPQGSRGDFDAPYRIFVAAALTASKFLIDNGMRNETMSRATRGVFTARDVSRAERTFLRLINYRLWVEPSELMFMEKRFRSTARCSDADNVIVTPISVVVQATRPSIDIETASIASSLSDTDSACETMEEATSASALPKASIH